MDYASIKLIHVSCVVFSLGFFGLRAVWSLTSAPILQARWVRILPPCVDTILLASAITLAVKLQQYPLVNGWLTAKVAGLLLYIALGRIALKGRTFNSKLAATIGAVVTVIYIVSVAITKSVTPWV